MFGSSSARVRQILTILCLSIIFILSLIIMGSVGVNGKITFRSFEKACLLYMTVDGDVITYNNGFCLFPIVGAAVVAVLSLVFLIYWIVDVHRKDEFAARSLSITFLFIAALLALLSFAICGEIGIGLNKGCRILGSDNRNCRSRKNFNALYGAEISAGLMGGFWILAMLLELFQLRCRPRALGVDHLTTTTVVPNTHHSYSNVTNSKVYPSGKSPAVVHSTTTYGASAKEEYDQPEMTSYPAHGSQYQTPYQQHQQPYQQNTPQQQQYYPAQDQQHQHTYTPPPGQTTATTTETTVVDTLPASGAGVVGTDYHH
ncbi:hypothetical protein BGZ83_007675 [Gryganskiella cystojenkinii]|nr:hypothetical protein BGZ83_007675 [Gryganskiella cystojenkinii]